MSELFFLQQNHKSLINFKQKDIITQYFDEPVKDPLKPPCPELPELEDPNLGGRYWLDVAPDKPPAVNDDPRPAAPKLLDPKDP